MFLGKQNAGAVAGPFFPLAEVANIITPCSQGNNFSVTLTASRTLANPLNPIDGQVVTWEVTQGGSGSYTLTLDTKFVFGSTITSITWSTAVGSIDRFCARYSKARDKWDVEAFVGGFT